MADRVLIQNLSEPLNGATSARVDIYTSSGNLTIDQLACGEPLLASGALQYLEKQGLPLQTLNTSNGQATLILSGGDAGCPWFHFPWATRKVIEWQIHLNPTVPSEIIAHSGGGNVKLDLTGMAVTRISADVGGGNMEVVLPDNASSLNVTASTGAGNVAVLVPSGVAARIRATSGLGKVSVDPQFSQVNGNTYESPGYDEAAHKVEIMADSGAGNVSVNVK